MNWGLEVAITWMATSPFCCIEKLSSKDVQKSACFSSLDKFNLFSAHVLEPTPQCTWEKFNTKNLRLCLFNLVHY